MKELAVKPTVLIIDDHADYAAALDVGLSGKYSVLVAHDGLDGYALAREKCPAAIIVDVMMPIVDGWTVVRKLRLNPQLATTPVIVVTAVDRATIKAEAVRFQVANVLQKPCGPDEVSRALEAALKTTREDNARR